MREATSGRLSDSSRVRSLDGIRAIAALAVFGYHAVVPGVSGGWAGVEVFFVLSGYLITGLLLQEHDRTGTVSLERFWVRRLRRLWPALLVMLVIVAPFYRLGSGTTTFSSFPSYLGAAAQAGTYSFDFNLNVLGSTYVGYLAHTWTLGVEMYFYVLWAPFLAFVLWRYGRAQLPAVIAGLGVASVLAATLQLTGQPASWAVSDPLIQAFPLLAGSLLAALKIQGRYAVRIGGVLAGLGLAGVMAVIVAASWSRNVPSFYVPMLLATLSTWVLLLGLQLSPASRVARVLAWRPLAALGLASYSFYLYQSPIILTLGSLIDPLALRVALLLPMTVGVATASYVLVERRYRRPRQQLRLSTVQA